jgi:signal recognition particle subunit SRP19
MRKQNKIVLWPAYFDSTKTRKQGRKTPKNVAVPAPRQDELQKAAQKIGLQTEMIADAHHPKNPWQKTGLIIVPKNTSKTQIIHKVSKELTNIRTQNRN